MLSATRHSNNASSRSPAMSRHGHPTMILDSDDSTATVSIFTASDSSSQCREHMSLSSAESLNKTGRPFREGTVVIYHTSNNRYTQNRTSLSPSDPCHRLIRRKSAFASTKAPWRPPGKWQIPDVFKTDPLPYPALVPTAVTTQRRKSYSTPDQADRSRGLNLRSVTCLHKKPWIPAGKPPDCFPIPKPVSRSARQKPHGHFEKMMKKVVPSTKIIEQNPKDRYVNFIKIGSGANGAVIRASCRHSSKQVYAIKRCFIDDTDQPHLAYILRELRIMGSLNHENIVAIKEVTLWSDHIWIAMEMMSCSIFALLCQISTGLPEEIAVFLVEECLNGLIFLHSKGYMHRDIKCENLLVSKTGQVKLADFGLATPLNVINSARLGTAKWMAPEVIREFEYSEKVDVWSMAITIIEMMDRVPPLYYLDNTDDIFAEILWGAPASFSFAFPTERMKDMVMWMLDKDTRRRPTAKSVLLELQRLLSLGLMMKSTQADVAKFVRQALSKAT